MFIPTNLILYLLIKNKKIFLNTIFSQSNKHILKNINTNYVKSLSKISNE